ncbi:alkaline phosphatase family protein [[Mycobacterium] kokjensenii]|uniref:Alkaline phosphatase family protein n=1 Tax=[Mycobacterium] kokjensenii TaxID=3064287 RepID=A0ABM9LW83_9MYCO|nr:alkaline phosphatase family protein [Mycolicibacter sp. MU0083]CAJ1505725.1 alkaline phosphatase family protein [Mycolicibacter sp. MU0083]
MTTVKKFLCGAAVAGLVAGTGAAVGTSPVALSAVTAEWMLAAEHVLLLGTDGTNLDKILEYAYDDDSGFKMLMDRGVTAATSIVGHQTMSTPSWSTILTGVWDDKHGVVSNVYRPEPYTTWPSVFNLIEYHKPEVDTTVISGRGLFTEMASTGGYPADHIVGISGGATSEEMDALVTAETISRILATTQNPNLDTFMFSYQSQVDHAGHSFSGGSEEYRDAVINVGDNFRQILEAVEQAEAATGDKWTIIAVTDHGHHQTVTLPGFSLGHGFQSPNETSSFIMFSLAGNEAQNGAQNLSYQTVDITPTILQAFGIPMRSDFDGTPMQLDPEILNSTVFPDDLKQALTDAIDSYGYPNIGTDIALSIRALAGGAGFFIGSYLLPPIIDYLQTIVDKDIFLISDLAEGVQWVLNTVGPVVADVATEVGRAIAYLTGAGVIAPNDDPLPLPGGAEFTVPDFGDQDVPLLDIDALLS